MAFQEITMSKTQRHVHEVFAWQTESFHHWSMSDRNLVIDLTQMTKKEPVLREIND